MPDVRGLDFARLIAPLQKPIVFTTAYAEHAVEGFSLQALDYLLKPIEFGRFLQTCNRAYTQVMPAWEESPAIFVKDGYDWIRVNVAQVLYIQSDTNLLFIHEQDRQVSTRMTIGDMLATLPAQEFIRVHKSYIVALRAIRKIERHQVTVGTVTWWRWQRATGRPCKTAYSARTSAESSQPRWYGHTWQPRAGSPLTAVG